jgi:hypothetical protein
MRDPPDPKKRSETPVNGDMFSSMKTRWMQHCKRLLSSPIKNMVSERISVNLILSSGNTLRDE